MAAPIDGNVTITKGLQLENVEEGKRPTEASRWPDFPATSDGIVCEIEATVVSGFEPLAKEEIEEKFGVPVWTSRGRVNMLMPIENVKKVLSLRGVDNIMLVLNRCSGFPFSDSLDEAMVQLRSIVPLVDWKTALLVWSKFFEFQHPIAPHPVQNYDKPLDNSSTESQGVKPDATVTPPINPASLEKDSFDCTPSEGSDLNAGDPNAEPCKKKTKLPKDPLLPSYRATCNRTGTKHCFQSPQAANHFGGEINNYFGWNVDLENYDIEVVLNIDDDNVRVGIALTTESLHRRDISNFGPTTLRPTIAYGMLRLCKIQPGETVCDPMCGGGSIPIEAALNWPLAHHFCGDIYGSAPTRTVSNIRAVNNKRRKKEQSLISADVFRWDACSLPLRDDFVDVFITDMPFGKRIGSRQSNWHLYPRILQELARVSKLETGRACLLTHDRKCISKCLNAVGHLWKRGPTLGINIGGLAASVYLLFRTSALYDNRESKIEEK